MHSLQAAAAQQCPKLNPGQLRLPEAVYPCTRLEADVVVAEQEYDNAKRQALAAGVWIN